MKLFYFPSCLKIYIVFAFILSIISCSSQDIALRDCAGNTCLHYAVFFQNIEEVKKLIKAGADINAVNDYGLTPLRCAASLNNKDIMELLIDKGAITNYSPAVKNPATRELLNNIIRFPEEKLNFFLTFDTGSDDKNLDYILKVLKRYRIVATFFTTGEFIEKFPDDIKRILNEGHVIGNHTYSHNMNYPDADSLLDELYLTEVLFKKTTGREIARIWRSPGLQHIDKPWMIDEAEKLGYRHIDVNLGSADWIEPDAPKYISNEKFLQLFKSHLGMEKKKHAIIDRYNFWDYYRKKPDYHGTIMLMHAGSFRKDGKDFVYTLDDIVRYLLSAGYVFDNCKRFEYKD